MTAFEKIGPTGQIAVEVVSNSIFFRSTVPIEVRDAGLRLIAKTSTSRILDLPAGLYQVSAILEDGRRHSALAEVKGGERTAMRLAAEQVEPLEASTTGEDRPPRYERPRYTRSMVPPRRPAGETGLAGSRPVLVEARGASLVGESHGQWVFQCAPSVSAVPSARYRIGTRELTISLPISPAGFTPSGSCVVAIEPTPAGAHAQAWISPERTVANAMQNMLSSGYLLEGARVADEAVSLLRDKYEDPAGAALGGLLLYKVGSLARWESWVENLARDFEWLPDGKVLLARLRCERDATSDELLKVALAASRQRMLYAESYSLLLDLLRRWPRPTAGDEREQAVQQLAESAPDIEWESVCLSQWAPARDE